MASSRVAVCLALALTFVVAGAGAGLTTATAERKRPLPRWQTLPEVPPLPPADLEADVPVDGATVHVAVFGQGPPVVLLHGGCGHGGQFGFQVPALAAGHRVIVVDARGQGRSGLPAGGLSYRGMADDVVAVLDHLQVPQAAVVGWSDGAIVALDLAMRHPTRVGRVVAFAANIDPSGTMKPRARAALDRYYARCAREQAALQPDPRRRTAARAALRAMWKREPRYSREQVGAIRVPVTIVHAERDELIRAAHAEELAALIPGARHVVLRDVGHFAMFQDPDQWHRVVADALAAPAPAP